MFLFQLQNKPFVTELLCIVSSLCHGGHVTKCVHSQENVCNYRCILTMANADLCNVIHTGAYMKCEYQFA